MKKKVFIILSLVVIIAVSAVIITTQLKDNKLMSVSEFYEKTEISEDPGVIFNDTFIDFFDLKESLGAKEWTRKGVSYEKFNVEDSIDGYIIYEMIYKGLKPSEIILVPFVGDSATGMIYRYEGNNKISAVWSVNKENDTEFIVLNSKFNIKATDNWEHNSEVLESFLNENIGAIGYDFLGTTKFEFEVVDHDNYDDAYGVYACTFSDKSMEFYVVPAEKKAALGVIYSFAPKEVDQYCGKNELLPVVWASNDFLLSAYEVATRVGLWNDKLGYVRDELVNEVLLEKFGGHGVYGTVEYKFDDYDYEMYQVFNTADAHGTTGHYFVPVVNGKPIHEIYKYNSDHTLTLIWKE